MTESSSTISPRSSPKVLAFTNSLVNLTTPCETLDEAVDAVAVYLNQLRPGAATKIALDAVRAKAYEAAKQRRLTIPFELRWRAGGGEALQGWDTLAKRLKELGLYYKVSTLKTQLSAGKVISIDLVNEDTGLLDVFSIMRIKIPGPRRGRPTGSKNKVPSETRADRVAAILNPTGNKMRGVL